MREILSFRIARQKGRIYPYRLLSFVLLSGTYATTMTRKLQTTKHRVHLWLPASDRYITRRLAESRQDSDIPHPFSSLASNGTFEHYFPATTRGRGGLTSSSAGEFRTASSSSGRCAVSVQDRTEKHLFYIKRYTIAALKIQALLPAEICSPFQSGTKTTRA